jgi:hypothetical protein
VNVVAVSTIHRPDWRWRIVDYGGETIEESSTTFPTIADAVAAGTAHLQGRRDQDRPLSPGASWRGRR